MTQNEKLVTVIKEVVRAEVKKQVNEQLTTLVLRMKQILDQTSTKTQPIKSRPKVDLREEFDDYVPTPQPRRSTPKEFTKNPILNEILNETQPFTASERATGGGANPIASMMGGSVLDAIQRDSEEDWGTVELNTDSMNGMMQQSPPVDVSANPEGVDAVAKALTRNYSELVKRFK